MGTFHRLFAVLRDRKGNAMLIAAFAMPVLVGASGLATDTIQWTLWKRQLQRQADSAALAGAYALAQGANVNNSATAEINRYNLVTLTGSPVIQNAPTTGAFAGDTSAVRVVLSTSQTLPFSSFFLSSPPVITAEATARVVAGGEYCVVSLETTDAVGVEIDGNASVDMGCGIITNSKASNAVSAGGSSQVKATPVAAVGGLQSSSNYVSPTTLLPYTIPQADPFADLPTPDVSTLCNSSNSNNKLTVGPNITFPVSMPAGGVACYKGMDLKGTVSLAAGVYVIDGGSFSVGSQATVTGTNVTIILTSKTAANSPSTIAKIDINGGANIQLTAPSTGTYAGVIFYQDERATYSGNSDTNKINGNANSILEGAIYVPSQAVEFSGTSGMNTKCLQIVSRKVKFTGNNNITNQCDEDSGADSFTGTRVRLVG
ncbi:pilus assembly protein TadG-related protein [Rhizorhapis sp.]|uniref:pilus assembly protein TadG-related protein n=1 Tax=Rhizorhapis sp. TaxID=1968842 RepID=UPI002B46C910|nr:pilus assembly protein TadG-related protein [Rhizorhapis sp.]HKR18464.1 pilus assembly protein TadG-related protein [Rhizorhapis sp.]